MNFRQEYESFKKAMDTGVAIPPEQVGKLIVTLAHYFSEAIDGAVNAEHAYNKRLAEFEQSTDAAGKPMSSTKAESSAKATPEHLAYLSAKGQVTACEQMINALKSLQRSLQHDYGNAGM